MAGRCHRSWFSSASSASMYHASLRGSTGMWVLPQLDFAWLSQPGEAPSCIGLTSRGGTGMRDPPQLGFAVLPSQPRDW